MPIYRLPTAAPAAAAVAGGVVGARDGTIVQHGDQSTSGQQQRQTVIQQRQVLLLHAATVRLSMQYQQRMVNAGVTNARTAKHTSLLVKYIVSFIESNSQRLNKIVESKQTHTNTNKQ